MHKQTDRHTDRHTDRQTDRQTDIQTDRQTDRQTDIQTDRQTDRQTGSQAGRQAGRQPGRQTDIQINKHLETTWDKKHGNTFSWSNNINSVSCQSYYTEILQSPDALLHVAMGIICMSIVAVNGDATCSHDGSRW